VRLEDAARYALPTLRAIPRSAGLEWQVTWSAHPPPSDLSPATLLGVQFTRSLVLFALVAKWHISPALMRLPVHSALVPLFLVHALRYLPSSAFAPAQIDPHVPARAMEAIAYGDGAQCNVAPSFSDAHMAVLPFGEFTLILDSAATERNDGCQNAGGNREA